MNPIERKWPTYLAVAGAIAGVAGGLFLGILRLANSGGPLLQAESAGNVVFTLVYLAPFALSLGVLFWAKPLWRAAVWGAAAVLAGLGAFTAFSGVSLVLLPAAVLLAPASVGALLQTPARGWPAALAIAAALVTLVAGAWLVLFMGEDAGRCWVQVSLPGGDTEWRASPYGQSIQIAPDNGEEPRTVRSTCSSDIITTSEAASGLLLLVAAGLLLTGLAPRWPQPLAARVEVER